MSDELVTPQASSLPHAACNTCPAYTNAQLRKLGLDVSGWDYTVALAGNPNTGKSTVFNALTGLRQHTGNWAGKTVTRAEGGFRFQGKRYKLVDLPGTYSLLSTSADEEVARDFLLFGQPHVTVIVADATRLERNLNLVLQILAITDSVVVAVNLIDEARRHGIMIDERGLARDLGVPVVPIVARRGEGLPELLSTIAQVASGAIRPRPRHVPLRDAALERAVKQLVAQIEAVFPNLPQAYWVALRLLDGDASIAQAVREGTIGDLTRGQAVAPIALEAA
ncbi:FeoB small GTPase domain-containing protein [Candidatus Chloroploca sp. Khr17]|uniref:FeoB small GTPase domain-containing protein n=1 Tax=Candidatus Chloroploca sp. Khr17 TaxID=2496869 RepID=UPI0013ED8BA7|nr:FeoB small GTPase domain-containing protein [Candidatus Chloroploca sp. Khr17]